MRFTKAVAIGFTAAAVWAASVQASVPAARVLIDGAEAPVALPVLLAEGRALVPLRQIGAALGAGVEYNPVTGDITVTKEGTVLQIKPGLEVFPPAFRDFSPEEAARHSLNRESRIVDGRTYVPVRTLAELLGAKVSWDEGKKAVKIDLTEGETIAFRWFELTEAGPVYHAEARPDGGNWYGGKHLPYLDFAVVGSEKDYLSQPPLQTLVPIAPPAADYTQHIGLWAYLGEAPTGGYAIQIERVVRTGDAVRVQVRLIAPEPDAMVTMAINYPTDYVLIDRSSLGSGEKVFTFVDQAGQILKTITVTL